MAGWKWRAFRHSGRSRTTCPFRVGGLFNTISDGSSPTRFSGTRLEGPWLLCWNTGGVTTARIDRTSQSKKCSISGIRSTRSCIAARPLPRKLFQRTEIHARSNHPCRGRFQKLPLQVKPKSPPVRYETILS